MRAAGRLGAVRAHPLDDAPEVVVADRLAVLAHRDHGVVDLLELVGGQREAERLAALLHGVAAGVAAEHELRRPAGRRPAGRMIS